MVNLLKRYTVWTVEFYFYKSGLIVFFDIQFVNPNHPNYMEIEKNRSLKEELTALLDQSKRKPSLSLKEVFDTLSGKARLFILIFLSLPFCQPIPIPGLSILFGMVIALIGLRIAFGKGIWLPKRIVFKSISSKTIQKIISKTLYLMNKIKRFMHARLNWICEHSIMQIVNGFLIFLLGVFLALPLPIPFTNFIAGWALFLMSLGLLEKDGIFVIIGYSFAFLNIIIVIFIILSFKTVF